MNESYRILLSIRYIEKLFKMGVSRIDRPNILRMLGRYYKKLNKEIEKDSEGFIFVNMKSRRQFESLFEITNKWLS